MRIPSLKALGLSVGMSVDQVSANLAGRLGDLKPFKHHVQHHLVIRCNSWKKVQSGKDEWKLMPNGLALLFNEDRQFLGFSRSPKFTGLTCSKGTSKPRNPFRRCRKDAGTTREGKS